MFDIDHFKVINDKHGHLAGDHVLRELAVLMLQNLRRQDILARYGGEEFAIILPEVDLQSAALVCEKLRAMTQDYVFAYNRVAMPVTISLGLTCYADGVGASTPTDFIAEADQYLYQAKMSGRNRVGFKDA